LLPPATLLKELQTCIARGLFGPRLRSNSPVVFWNLVVSFLVYDLPIGNLAALWE
jgi:hypothetical protein